MLVKLNLSPDMDDTYINTDSITAITVKPADLKIAVDINSCDRYTECFPSADELNTRFKEMQSWFAPTSMSATIKETTVDSPAPAAAANNPMRNCNGYNTKACEHNGKAYDCSGCPFESTTKRLVDTFMQLPDALKAQFIDEALSHQCITEDEFSMLMGTLPEEDPTPTTSVDSTPTPTDDEFFKPVATLQLSVLQSTILPNAWKVSVNMQVGDDVKDTKHRLLIYKKADVDFVNSIINKGLNQFTSSATEAIDSIVDNKIGIR